MGKGLLYIARLGYYFMEFVEDFWAVIFAYGTVSLGAYCDHIARLILRELLKIQQILIIVTYP